MGKRLSCDLWVGCGGGVGEPFILEFCTAALGSGDHCTAVSEPEAARCMALPGLLRWHQLS